MLPSRFVIFVISSRTAARNLAQVTEDFSVATLLRNDSKRLDNAIISD